MDDGLGLGMRNWPYYEQPLKNSLGLHLTSSAVVDRDTKPLLPNGGFLQPSFPMEFVRDGWINHRDNNNNKIFHVMPVNSNYAGLSDASRSHPFQMLQPPNPPPEDDKHTPADESGGKKETPLKKRPQGRPHKSPKPKKPKKIVTAPKDENRKSGKKVMALVINGIDLDLSGIPTPVCSCTGTSQQCYRWGIGGWQSACCTTSMSEYPLPMSTKRRGVRIAGRKMSQGAFKKVLEKLAGEGHNLSNPIDLKPYWAKHGTNKFVTIR